MKLIFSSKLEKMSIAAYARECMDENEYEDRLERERYRQPEKNHMMLALFICLLQCNISLPFISLDGVLVWLESEHWNTQKYLNSKWREKRFCSRSDFPPKGYG